MKAPASMISGVLLTGLACCTLAFGGELEAAKAEFHRQDRVLNQVYQVLKDQLPAEQFSVLRKEQRSWIHYRDHISGWQAHGKQLADSAEYWRMMATLTESRADWLTAWKLIDQRKDWTGNYSDSHGGHLRIHKQGDKYHFIVDVVRGPTFHLGHIGGELTIKGDKAIYETQVDEDAGLTRIGLSPLGDGTGRLKLVGANTSYFHGARAYFDGNYLWTGELSEADKKQFSKDQQELEGP